MWPGEPAVSCDVTAVVPVSSSSSPHSLRSSRPLSAADASSDSWRSVLETIHHIIRRSSRPCRPVQTSTPLASMRYYSRTRGVRRSCRDHQDQVGRSCSQCFCLDGSTSVDFIIKPLHWQKELWFGCYKTNRSLFQTSWSCASLCLSQ